MKLRNSYWIWPYRPDSLPPIILTAILAYVLIAGSYWVSTLRIHRDLQNLLPNYTASLNTLTNLISVAKARPLTNAEIDTLNAISLPPPISKYLQRKQIIEWAPNNNSIFEEKARQIESYQHHLVILIKDSSLSEYTRTMMLGLMVISTVVFVYRFLFIFLVFNPREIATSNTHPIFSVLIIEIFILLFAVIVASDLIISNIYGPIHELIRQATLIGPSKILFSSDLIFDFTFLPDATIDALLFDDREELGLVSSVFIFALVALCTLAAAISLHKRTGDVALFVPFFGSFPPIFVAMSSLFSRDDFVEAHHRLTFFRLFGLHVDLVDASGSCILTAGLSIIIFLAGFISRSKKALCMGYGGLVLTAGWYAFSVLAYAEKTIIGLLVIIIVSFVFIVFAELAARNAMVRRIYDPD